MNIKIFHKTENLFTYNKIVFTQLVKYGFLWYGLELFPIKLKEIACIGLNQNLK